jgi:membrane protein DedA with SNARE-associated domain
VPHAASWDIQQQRLITLGEIVLVLNIVAEAVIFIGYTAPGHSILNSLGLAARQ